MPEDEWSPDKPMKDAKDEDECQREAQARARVNFLQGTYEKKSTPEPKRKGLFR